jgi:hypothetical protein
MELVFMTIGTYFSGKFVTAAIAKDLYMVKNPDYRRKKRTNLELKFLDDKINSKTRPIVNTPISNIHDM